MGFASSWVGNPGAGARVALSRSRYIARKFWVENFPLFWYKMRICNPFFLLEAFSAINASTPPFVPLGLPNAQGDSFLPIPCNLTTNHLISQYRIGFLVTFSYPSSPWPVSEAGIWDLSWESLISMRAISVTVGRVRGKQPCSCPWSVSVKGVRTRSTVTVFYHSRGINFTWAIRGASAAARPVLIS